MRVRFPPALLPHEKRPPELTHDQQSALQRPFLRPFSSEFPWRTKGFPNEDRAAFQNTLDLVDKAGISRVHTFPYSARPGTAAEALGDRVAPEEKKRRAQAMRGLSEVRSRHHRTRKLARTERVLVDKVAETQCAGYSADYTRCYLPAGAAAAGELIDATVAELHADGLLVTPCADPG